MILKRKWSPGNPKQQPPRRTWNRLVEGAVLGDAGGAQCLLGLGTNTIKKKGDKRYFQIGRT
jgi:hypothetical protein